jgi:hypothetical protein
MSMLLPIFSQYHQNKEENKKKQKIAAERESLPCHIHTMTFFWKKPKGTHCWMRILNYTPTPIYYTCCAIPIPDICSHNKINFTSLTNHKGENITLIPTKARKAFTIDQDI